MSPNKREVYIRTSSGDQLLVEVEEIHGWVVVSGDGFRLDLDPDSAFDLVDALTMVSNEMTSHVGGVWE